MQCKVLLNVQDWMIDINYRQFMAFGVHLNKGSQVAT